MSTAPAPALRVMPTLAAALEWVAGGAPPVEAPSEVSSVPSKLPTEAAESAKTQGENKRMDVLVTGSLYMVGGALEAISRRVPGPHPSSS